jgi:hypothetical protein
MNNTLLKLLGAGVLAVSLTACPGMGGNTADKGGGNLQGWPSSTTGKLEFTSYSPATGVVTEASSNVSASGEFSYQLPTPPKGDLYGFDGAPTCIKPSDPNAKTTSVFITAYEGTSTSPSGYVSLATQGTRAAGAKEAIHVYADRNVKITGTCTDSGQTVVYDADLKKGWNFIIATFEEVNGSGQPTKVRITASVVLGGDFKWWYHDYSPSQASSPKPFPQLAW